MSLKYFVLEKGEDEDMVKGYGVGWRDFGRIGDNCSIRKNNDDDELYFIEYNK